MLQTLLPQTLLFQTLVGGALMLAASGAAAQETAAGGGSFDSQEPTPEAVREAGEQFNAGRAAYKDEDYLTAAERFERADSLAPNPKVLWLAIDSRERAGHHSRAATLAALATQLYPGDATFEPANELLRAALQNASRLKVECDEPCTVLVDTRLVHGRPMEKRFVFLDPGTYRIKAFWDGNRSEVQSYTAAAGQHGRLSFTAPPAAQAPASEPLPEEAENPSKPVPSDSQTQASGAPLGPAVFWTGTAITAGLLGVSIWSGIDAKNNPGKDVVRERCINLGESCPEYQDGLSRQRRTNILWGVTAGVGVITTLVGVLWTDWGTEAAPAPTKASDTGRLSIRPVFWVDSFGVGRGEAGLGAVGRF